MAEDAKPGERDAGRALTSEGKKKLRELLRSARASGVRPGLIISSPYVRAVQTAAIAAAVFNYSEKVLQVKALQPASDPAGVWEEIRLHKDVKELLLVGHEPLLGCSAAYLLGAPSLQIDFKKGALLRIDVAAAGPQPRGVLKWMLTPKLA